MKRIAVGIVVILFFGIIGCEDDNPQYYEVYEPPPVPQGVYSVTGNDTIFIYWLPVQDPDFDHYRIYWSPDDDLYEYMASTETESYIDTDVDTGVTYYYAVTSIDNRGEESDLSYETVFDTPRPEGQVLLSNARISPDEAGYDFSAYSVVSFDNPEVDVYLDFDTVFKSPDSIEAVFFINVGDYNTDIQDMGYTYSFDEIGWAPEFGWSEIGWCEINQGHTYLIWTADNHFAKLRVDAISGGSAVQFRWAYQTDLGNPELARPQHDENYLNRPQEMTVIK